MEDKIVSIETLIEIVEEGGVIKTGVNVHNPQGILLLKNDVYVRKRQILDILKENGLKTVPFNESMEGGIWDEDGNELEVEAEPQFTFPDAATQEIEKRLIEIQEVKQEAKKKYTIAKKSIRKVLDDIKDTGGEFDYQEVEKDVTELVDFLIESNNPFSYITQELFSYDDYLYNHSINVCAIGTAILHRFNRHFSSIIDNFLAGKPANTKDQLNNNDKNEGQVYHYYCKDELADISTGFFLHDVGKVMVDDKVLNQSGKLSPKDYEEVKKHSFEYGMNILEKNQLNNSIIKGIIKYHHGQLFKDEDKCYPMDRSYTQVPIYARICKLADIYDAMTSKRVYKEAINSINVVTKMFRQYAKKDRVLQYVLHAFVKSIGIYPPGSIIFLKNGQMAYVLESEGPVVIPFTDSLSNTLKTKPDPINMSEVGSDEFSQVDNSKSIQNPKEVYQLLPSYLKRIILPG